MLIYIDEILNEIESIREYAKIIKKKFKKGRPSEELLLDVQALEKRIEYLLSVLPDGVNTGNTYRHIHFLILYLTKDKPDSCKGDIYDIVKFDLPEISENVRNWANGLQYVDTDLKKGIATLIKTKQFDSAIRKAFVILKTRLCEKYSLDENIDGDNLVNKIFGKNSSYLEDLSLKQKAAYRDFFAGLFALSRNRYAHHHVDATLSELDMVISNINYCLKLIDDFQTAETEINGDPE